MIIVVWLLFWVAVSGGIGAAIGNTKGRPGAGFLLGLFFGFIGWIIIAVMDPSVDERHRRTIEMAAVLNGPQRRGQIIDDRAVLAPRAGHTVGADAQRQFDSMLAACHGDPDEATLAAAVSSLARSGRVTRPMHGWVFSDGAYCLAVKHDGVVQLVDRNLRWSACPVGSRASAVASADGEILELWVGDRRLERPRPSSQARAMASALNAAMTSAPAVLASPSPAPALASPPPPPPAAATVEQAERSAVDALRQLETLRSEGLISDDEYAVKRDEVLRRL